MFEMTSDEHRLARLIVDVLDLEEVLPEGIDPNAPLFGDGLNLDSIDALEIAVAVAKDYGVHLKAEDQEVRAVFASLRSLSTYIKEQVERAR